MNAAIATPKNPEIAGCRGSLRTTRSTVIATALPTEVQMAAVRPKNAFARTKTITGTDE